MSPPRRHAASTHVPPDRQSISLPARGHESPNPPFVPEHCVYPRSLPSASQHSLAVLFIGLLNDGHCIVRPEPVLTLLVSPELSCMLTNLSLAIAERSSIPLQPSSTLLSTSAYLRRPPSLHLRFLPRDGVSQPLYKRRFHKEQLQCCYWRRSAGIRLAHLRSVGALLCPSSPGQRFPGQRLQGERTQSSNHRRYASH